jgi:phosphatidylglycerol---prolipoprotein diacylglyceryl transferase
MKKYAKLSQEELDTLLLYVFFWVIGGGRIGYVILYNLGYFIENPLDLLKIWEWGMSFHGGFIWVLLAVGLFAKKYKKSFFSITDTLAVIIPVALGLGRIGNWINGELPGYTPYSGPLPLMINGASHFPNPLLEMLLEWVILFIVMIFFWKCTKIVKKTGILSGIFLIWYSIARLVAEKFRLPDTHIGYIFGSDWVTLGMIYTLPMLLVGVFLVIRKDLSGSRRTS